MLERIPGTKAVLNGPAHAESKKVVCAAIKAQTPLISMIKKTPNITLGSLNNTDLYALEHAKEHLSGLFHLALLKLLASDGSTALRLELPIAPDKGIILFAREVGSAWDTFCSSGENPGIGEYGHFARVGTDENALFSRSGNSSFVLSELLLKAKRAVGEAETFHALSNFRAGMIVLDELKEVYAKNRIDLKEARVHDDGVQIGTGGNLVLLPHVENRWEAARKNSEKLLGEIAKRMSVGFNPLL